MALNANALTTLAFAKTYLKIPTAEVSQDSIVEFWINAASDYLETATDRKFKSQSFTEIQHGRATNILILKHFPVTAITSFYTDSTGKYSGDQELVDLADYSIGEDQNCLIYNRYFPRGYNNLKITYTAGYATIPSDLENACLWMVTYYHKMRESGDIGRTSKGKGDESINILQEAPQDVKNTIMRYKRVDIPISNAMPFNG